jgi:hypothetical protein
MHAAIHERFSGETNVDEVVVGLYRNHQSFIEGRWQLASKQCSMQQVRLIEAVPECKGVRKIVQEAAGTTDAP